MPHRVLLIAARPSSANRATIGRFLEEHQVPFESVEPADWESGMTVQPGLILLEHCPPWIDCLELFDDLAKAAERSGAPVLVFSDVEHAAEASTALGRGAADVLPPGTSGAEFWSRIHAAIQLRKRLKDLSDAASKDGLTSLFNRPSFELQLRNAWLENARNGCSLALLMIDLDWFKRINDTRGHLVGDETLRRTAEVLRSAIRDGDIAARYGGEEFAILAPSSGLGSAVALAERIRRKLASMRTIDLDLPATLTASIGIATLDPRSIEDPRELIRRADLALYEAKGDGRDCIRWHEESVEAPQSGSTPVILTAQ